MTQKYPNKPTDPDKARDVDFAEEAELTPEEHAALLEQFDVESRTRHLTGIMAGIVFVALISFS